MAVALVTGASGFVGRALVRRLLARGDTVVGLTRGDTALDDGAETVRIGGLDGAALERALAGRRFDIVYHLAAYGVEPGARDPDTMFDANVRGTMEVVRLAARAGARRVVYAGSCAEYEFTGEESLVSEDAPLTQTALYGASKVAGGYWGRAFAAQLGVSFVWLRLFGIYGEGEAAHRLLPSIVAGLRSGKRAALSPGTQMRDFLHIDDAVDGIIRAAEADGVVDGAPYNLCTGRPASVREVAELAADALGASRELLGFGDLDFRPGELMWLVGDPQRFQAATGFAPKISLADGVARTVRRLSVEDAA